MGERGSDRRMIGPQCLLSSAQFLPVELLDRDLVGTVLSIEPSKQVSIALPYGIR